MLLRDIGLDVDRVLCTEREPGVQQCTFIFKLITNQTLLISEMSYLLLFVNGVNVVSHIPK